MRILGINSAYHDSSGCLVESCRVVAAVEEERQDKLLVMAPHLPSSN